MQKVPDGLGDRGFGRGAIAGLDRPAAFRLRQFLRLDGAIALLSGDVFRRQRPVAVADRIVALTFRAVLGLDRGASGAARAQRLPGAHDRAGGQCDEHRRGGGHQRRVTSDELLKLIAGACRTRGDRLVGQVAAEVGGQRGRRRVAPPAVFLERFRDDGFDVAL